MTDLSHSRAWQVEALLSSARAATPLSTELGQSFVSIPLGTEAHQVIPLYSKAFRNWLLERFHTEHQVNPRASALRDVINLLEAKLQFGGGPRTPVARRIARTKTGILLDLYNDQGEAVEITNHGWSITSNLATAFRSTRSSRPLPRPQNGGSVEQLRKILHLTPEHFSHCMTWLNAAMSPAGPYPILVLQGPESSARTALAQVLRTLIDPGPAPFCPPPRSARDVHSLATHNWILAVDQIERLPTKVLRELTDLSTGTVIAARDCPSDPEPFHVYLQRPVLFTTAEPIPSSIGLTERALIVNVPAAEISSATFEQLHPKLLGALCDAAAQPQPKWEPAVAAPSPVTIAIEKFLNHRTRWTGTATELLQSLRQANPAIKWPETPKGLTQLLNRTPLRDIDFQSLKDSSSRRTVELRVINPEPGEQSYTPKDAPLRRTRKKEILKSHQKSAATHASRDG